MLKIDKELMKALGRFPTVYRMQAEKIIDQACRDIVSICTDSVAMAAMLVLIEQFGFGTTRQTKRLERFVTALQELLDYGTTRYDDALAEWLRGRLHNYGVEYVKE